MGVFFKGVDSGGGVCNVEGSLAIGDLLVEEFGKGDWDNVVIYS